MKKRINFKVFLYITSLMILAGCNSDFLTENPNTSLTEEQVFGDQNNLKLLVSGLYTQWRDTRKDRSALYYTMGTDEGKQGSHQVRENNEQAGLDKYNGAINPANPALAGEWNRRWPIVSAAAKAVFYAKSDQLKAEAAFIRAAINFELTMYWGPIPIVDLNGTKEARQPLEDVYKFIIKDLEMAVAGLPTIQTDKKMPTKGAAQALLGKIYMYAPVESNMRDYQKAADYFDMVIPQYSLLSNYADLFNTRLNQNSTETIYGFQFNNIQPDNHQVQHQAGSRAVANLDTNVFFGGYDLAMPTAYYHTTVWLNQNGDTRKNASIRYDFTLPNGRVPGLTWTGQLDELEPHTKKFEDIRTQGSQNFWYGGGIIYYLRLADILLCKAECMNELNKTTEAVELVNSTVRTRAYGGNLPANQRWAVMTQVEFRARIMDERMRELAFEGWRRMDLIRTEKLVELAGLHNPWAKQSATIRDFHKWYPIPESEIKQNEAINPEDQNKGY